MAIDFTNVYSTGSTMNSVTRKNNSSDTDSVKTKEKEKTSESSKEKAGVVYEKSSNTASTNTDYKTQNSALIAKLKADSNNRISQLKGIVEQMMSKQGKAIGTADNMWKFLAGGNYTVDAATKAQAQADVAEDGYWGVEQTSDRIVDFAKALSGGDSSKADEMINAFKKGFDQATRAWGKSLPDISQRTYDAVLKKFDTWVSGSENKSDEQTNEY